jgi:hypothetical protein
MTTQTPTDRLACTVSRTGRITWLCNVCGQPIKAKTGYLTADWGRALQQYWDAKKRDRQRWNETEARGERFVAFNVSELLDAPGPVSWQALHRDCDPDPERDDYWFGVERADTLAKVMNWTAHLMEKNWLPETNWRHLLRIVAGSGGGADA